MTQSAPWEKDPITTKQDWSEFKPRDAAAPWKSDPAAEDWSEFATREEVDAEARTRARAAAIGSLEINPELYAKARRLSDITGMPADAIYRNMPKVERYVYLDRMDRLVAESPITAETMSDRTTQNLAHDDVESLTLLETVGQKLRNGGQALANIVPAIGQGLYGAGRFIADGFHTGAQAIVAPYGGDIGRNSTGLVLGHQAAAAGAYLKANQPQADSKLESYVYGGITSGGASLAHVLLGPAGLGMMAVESGGSAYSEARDAGKSELQATRYGVTQGGVEYVTEKMSFGALQKVIKGEPNLIRNAGRFLVREGLGEQIATAVQDLDTQMTLHPEKSVAEYLRERPDRAVETLVQTIVAGGMAGTVGAAARAADRASVRKAQAEQLAQDRATIGEVLDAAGTSKLRERDAPAYREHADAALHGRSVTIDGAAFLQSFDSLPPEQQASVPMRPEPGRSMSKAGAGSVTRSAPSLSEAASCRASCGRCRGCRTEARCKP